MKGNKHTCNRPLSSRSPRNLTKTISSMERRTRSRGSETVAAAAAGESSARSAILCCVGWDKSSFLFKDVKWGCLEKRNYIGRRTFFLFVYWRS